MNWLETSYMFPSILFLFWNLMYRTNIKITFTPSFSESLVALLGLYSGVNLPKAEIGKTGFKKRNLYVERGK